jgi:uncharacterized protein (TIGR02246 family)
LLKTSTLVLIAVLWLGSCSPSQTSRPPDAATARDAIRAVRAATAARAAALARRDIEGWLAAYSDDAVWLPSHASEVVGKDLARARMKVLLEKVNVAEQQEAEEHVLLAPDVLLERGNYAVEITPVAGGDPVPDGGTFLTIWRKGAAGEWKISYQMWTSRGPVEDIVAQQHGGAK